MSKKTCVLLTASYPYGGGESFVETELPYAAKRVQLRVHPVEARNGRETRTPPEGVSCEALFDAPLPRWKLMLRAPLCFLRPELRRELHSLRASGRLTRERLHTLMAFVIEGERIMRALMRRYGRMLKNAPSDIVLYSYWLREGAYAAARLSEKYGCPAVSRTHRVDLYEEVEDGYLPLRDYLLSTLNAVCPISADGVHYLAQHYGHPEKLKLFYLGTGDEGVSPYSGEKKPFRIVSCAFLSPVKRIPLLARALALVDDAPIEWVHFGDGGERSAVEAEVKKLPPNVKCILRGNTPHEDILRYYRENPVHLFVNVSSSEGVPVSIMEAASFGIPILATEVGGTGELVIDGLDGKLVPAGLTEQTLVEELRAFVRMDAAAYEALREGARRHWEESFCAETNFERFYNMLQTL